MNWSKITLYKPSINKGEEISVDQSVRSLCTLYLIKVKVLLWRECGGGFLYCCDSGVESVH